MIFNFFDSIGHAAVMAFGGKSKEADLFIGILAIMLTFIGIVALVSWALSAITGIGFWWFPGSLFMSYCVFLVWDLIKRH